MREKTIAESYSGIRLEMVESDQARDGGKQTRTPQSWTSVMQAAEEYKKTFLLRKKAHDPNAMSDSANCREHLLREIEEVRVEVYPTEPKAPLHIRKLVGELGDCFVCAFCDENAGAHNPGHASGTRSQRGGAKGASDASRNGGRCSGCSRRQTCGMSDGNGRQGRDMRVHNMQKYEGRREMSRRNARSNKQEPGGGAMDTVRTKADATRPSY